MVQKFTHIDQPGQFQRAPLFFQMRLLRSQQPRQDQTQLDGQAGFPSTGKTSGPCPGYVIDHRVALKHGGLDDSGNMEWQTKAEAKAKDRVE
jgi:hypothetical protein